MHERNIAHRCGLARPAEALSQTTLGPASRGSSCAVQLKSTEASTSDHPADITWLTSACLANTLHDTPPMPRYVVIIYTVAWYQSIGMEGGPIRFVPTFTASAILFVKASCRSELLVCKCSGTDGNIVEIQWIQVHAGTSQRDDGWRSRRSPYDRGCGREVHTGSKYNEHIQASHHYHTQKWFQATRSVYRKYDS